MTMKETAKMLFIVMLYHSKPDHSGIRASVSDTLKPISIRLIGLAIFVIGLVNFVFINQAWKSPCEG